MAVKCSAQGCLHNHNGKCTSGMIQVLNSKSRGRADHYCGTHTRDEGTYLLTAMEKMSHPVRARGIFDNEIGDEMDLMHLRRPGNPAVLCGVTECAHNRNKSCLAGDIAIGRSLKNARFPCRTFRAK